MSYEKNALAIDVEEWFHICDEDITKVAGDIEKLPVRVVENTKRIVRLLKEHNQRGTFFFVGWVAERYPELVKYVAEGGFEIGCHSYSHDLIYKMDSKQFEEDLIKATDVIYRAAGVRPLGYRAPGFSIKRDMEWYFEILAKNQYRYDASVFPTYRAHGGIVSAPTYPYRISTRFGEILEFPQSVTGFSKFRICFSGGGYFRLLPLWFVKSQIRRMNSQDLPVLLYLHPREIDPDQPRMRLSPLRYFKYYVNLSKTEDKFIEVLKTFEFSTVLDTLEDFLNKEKSSN